MAYLSSLGGAVSDEQMRFLDDHFSLLIDEHMSNWLGIEHPTTVTTAMVVCFIPLGGGGFNFLMFIPNFGERMAFLFAFFSHQTLKIPKMEVLYSIKLL